MAFSDPRNCVGFHHVGDSLGLQLMIRNFRLT